MSPYREPANRTNEREPSDLHPVPQVSFNHWEPLHFPMWPKWGVKVYKISQVDRVETYGKGGSFVFYIYASLARQCRRFGYVVPISDVHASLLVPEHMLAVEVLKAIDDVPYRYVRGEGRPVR